MLPFRWTSTNHHGSGLMCFYMVGVVGLEPTTLGLKDRYSSQLSYTPNVVPVLGNDPSSSG